MLVLVSRREGGRSLSPPRPKLTPQTWCAAATKGKPCGKRQVWCLRNLLAGLAPKAIDAHGAGPRSSSKCRSASVKRSGLSRYCGTFGNFQNFSRLLVPGGAQAGPGEGPEGRGGEAAVVVAPAPAAMLTSNVDRGERRHDTELAEHGSSILCRRQRQATARGFEGLWARLWAKVSTASGHDSSAAT